MKRVYLLPLALLISLAPGLPAGAAPQVEPGTPVYVRFSALLTAYRKTQAFQTLQGRLRTIVQKLEAELLVLNKVRLAPAAIREEALSLVTREMIDDAGKKRIDELTEMARSLDEQFAALSQKQSPSPEEAARLLELSRERMAGSTWYGAQRAGRQKQINEADTEILRTMSREITALISKIAKEMKTPVVYDQSAIIYGGFDLTPEVVKRLPK